MQNAPAIVFNAKKQYKVRRQRVGTVKKCVSSEGWRVQWEAVPPG